MNKLTLLTATLSVALLAGCSGGNSSSSGSGGGTPKSTGTGVNKSICVQTHGKTWKQWKTDHQAFHKRVGWEDSPATVAYHKDNGSPSCYPNRPKRYHANPIGTHS